MLKYTDLDDFDAGKIKVKIESTGKFSCTVPYANRQSEEYIGRIIEILLELTKKPQLKDSLEYCMKELVMNASKANSKRVYFKELGLEITETEDYKKGMESFKSEVFGDFKKYAQKHKEQGFMVKIDFKLEKEQLIIRVANNSKICREEEKRIFMRLKNAGKFTNMGEVMMYGFDETEGAGFGLIITVLMLRKIGLDEKVFSFAKSNGFTAAIFKIPLNIITEEQSMAIAEEIVEEIDRMPQFPETILQLRKSLADPNCDFQSIADIITTDSSLTTEIIRIANSPIYMLPQKVDNVFSAVRMIGMKGVKNLALSFGVNKLMEQKYNKEKIAKVMDHSNMVAVYAGNLVKLKKMKALYDEAYVAALLHDFGKIIINSLKPDLIEKLEKVCFEKGIPISKLEELTEGYNHSIIGAELAERWNFPDKFIQSIRFHHLPLDADEKFKGLAYVVYIANEMCHYGRGERKFGDINRKILRFFKMEREELFKEMLEKINKSTEQCR